MSRKAATPVSKLTHALHGGRTADNNKYLGVAKRFHNVVTPLVAPAWILPGSLLTNTVT